MLTLNQWRSQSFNDPVNPPINQISLIGLVSQSISQPNSQPINQSCNQSINQLSKQASKQASNQLIGQSINQSSDLEFLSHKGSQ